MPYQVAMWLPAILVLARVSHLKYLEQVNKLVCPNVWFTNISLLKQSLDSYLCNTFFYFPGGIKFDSFGSSALMTDNYNLLFTEARAFILACYRMSDCASFNEARVKVWKTKMKRNSLEPPKLCSLPPTEEAFKENALRAHLTVATWTNCLEKDPPALHPTDHGWYHPEGSSMLYPTIVPKDIPMAPNQLLKLIKCSCCSESPCFSKRCSCRANGLCCTLFCSCKGEDCKNKA